MARNMNVIRPVIAGGVAAIGVAALASGVLLNPAQAADSNTGNTDNNLNAPQGNGPMGPMGDHGHGMRGGHMRDAHYGERISGTRTVKQADGTIVVNQMAHGTVSAVSANSITISTADGNSFVFAVNDSTNVSREHAAAAIADVVVGDWAHVSGDVANDVATAVEVHAESAATHEAEVAARTADNNQVDPQPNPVDAPPADDNDGDGPQGAGPDGDNDGDGPGMGVEMRGGHHGKGHRDHGPGMGDNDGDGPQGQPGGPMGGPMGKPDHAMHAQARGELISEVSVFQKTDGTFITVKDVAGLVTAVSGNSVTIDIADGSTATLDLTGATVNRDRAAATIADIVAGDHVRVEGTLSGDTLTITNADAISATEWAAHQTREAVESAAGQASTTSFSTKSVLKTKKTAIAQARAAKSVRA